MMKLNRPYQDEPQYLRVLQWNAGGLSQDKRKQLQQLLRSQEVDVFTIMEANLDNNTIKYHQYPGYTLYLLPKFRQVASGILTGIRSNLITKFEVIKEMGNDQDKSEVVKLDIWKCENHYLLYSIYSSPKKLS